jgi:molybdopterin molybdotransferase
MVCGLLILSQVNAAHAKVSAREADDLIRPFMKPLPCESISLERSFGRMLGEPIHADRPYPALDRVCMDGIAIEYDALVRGIRDFRISGTGKAGEAPKASSGGSACIEVMTGAPCPIGCDTVVPVEDLVLDGIHAGIGSADHIRRGQNIQPCGSECRSGDRLIAEGEAMNPARAAIAASVGKDPVRVIRTPRIRVISTGDEIVEWGSRPEPWQVRRSNTVALCAMVGRLAEVETRWTADDPEDLHGKIRWGLEGSDMLILSGGVSAGKFDLVPDALHRAGVSMIFHKAAIRPGKPIWFGRGPGDKPVFGLPGNPVSFMVCFRRFAMPLLQSLAGRASGKTGLRVRLESEVRTHRGLTLFLPVTAPAAGDGEWLARPCPTNGSGDFCGLGRSDGFVEIDGDRDSIPEGDSVPYFPWEG